MLVVIQFPIADGRRFAPAQSTVVARPNWMSPKVSPGADFMRGFGQMVARFRSADPAWTDDDFFVLARHSLRLPTLISRKVSAADGLSSWRVACAFRRFFHDGCTTARYEVGFSVEPAPDSSALDAESVVRAVLAIPARVHSVGAVPTEDKPLLIQGPRLAMLYARASTRSTATSPAPLVAAGAPMIAVQADGAGEVNFPDRAVDASIAAGGRIDVKYSLTPTSFGRVATWYLGPQVGGDPQPLRNLRLCLLRLHSEEEVLDQILSWAEAAQLDFGAETEAQDRLERYINRVTQLLNRNTAFGVQTSGLRDAMDAAAAVERASVPIRRRQRLDGMREQIQLKAERFIAQREALRPTGGIHVGDNVTFSGGNFYGPVAGTVHAQSMQNSFNAFAETKPSSDLRDQIAALHQEVAVLVAELDKSSPDAATDVTSTLTQFTDEAAKKEPNKSTLKRLGEGLIAVSKGVQQVAVPIATAVGVVLKIFGILAL